MIFLFFSFLLVVPLLELSLLVEIAANIGLVSTIGLSLLTAVLGAGLAKREFRLVWQGWQQAMTLGRPPEKGVIDGLLIAVGALLLFVPGVMTDVIGLSLLIPKFRRLFVRPVGAAIRRKAHVVSEGPSVIQTERASPQASKSFSSPSNVVDADYESVDEWEQQTQK